MNAETPRDDGRPLLEMWTIYQNPSDQPGMFVARRFEVGRGWSRPTDDAFMCEALPVMQHYFETHGYVWLPRAVSDDPVILGVYMR